MALTADELPGSATDELLTRARAGEADAFCKIAEQHESQLLRQACGMTGDADVAEDLAAETLVEAWRSLRRFDGSCKFSTWLFSILLHRFQKHVRRAKSRPVLLSELSSTGNYSEENQENMPATAASPSDDLIERETRDRVRKVLLRMPEHYREVLLLRFFEGASLAEIASALHCPVGTVKSRLHYGLEELRKARADLNPE